MSKPATPRRSARLPADRRCVSVAVKSVAQQDVRAVQRVRHQLVKMRTAMINRVLGLLAEYGVVIPQGVGHLPRPLPLILEDHNNGLSGLIRDLSARSASGSSSSKIGYASTTLGLNTPTASMNAGDWLKRKALVHGRGLQRARVMGPRRFPPASPWLRGRRPETAIYQLGGCEGCSGELMANRSEPALSRT